MTKEKLRKFIQDLLDRKIKPWEERYSHLFVIHRKVLEAMLECLEEEK